MYRFFIQSLIIIATIVYCEHAQADIDSQNEPTCYIITGISKDPFEALKEYSSVTRTRKARFGKLNCKRFRSWGELVQFHHKKLGHKQHQRKILIIQASHGDPGGGADLDSGYSTGLEILSYLKDISKDSKLAFIDQSCYSGDILFKKIYYDEITPQEPSIDNMCIISASTFNMPTQSDHFVDKLKDTDFSKQNALIDFFKTTRASMISGSPWASLIDVKNMIRGYSYDHSGFPLESFDHEFMALAWKDASVKDDCRGLQYRLFNMIEEKIGYELEPGEVKQRKAIYRISIEEAVSEYLEGLKKYDIDQCPWKPIADRILNEILSEANLDLNDLAQIAIVPSRGEASGAFNKYFGSASRKFFGSSDYSGNSLDVRRYKACINF